MAKKFYAVKKGRKNGIFEDWPSCESQVKGFPGAEYKSFKNISDAQEYLNKDSVKKLNNKDDERCYPCAYVDGSYDSGSHQYSFGAVIMPDADSELEFSRKFENSENANIRNVAGEIKGSEFAIQYALDQGWNSISIYYDYYGIEKWATGEWKRNLVATKSYFDFCQNALKKIKINFIKVKGHSGNIYNDKADALARKALNL